MAGALVVVEDSEAAEFVEGASGQVLVGVEAMGEGSAGVEPTRDGDGGNSSD